MNLVCFHNEMVVYTAFCMSPCVICLGQSHSVIHYVLFNLLGILWFLGYQASRTLKVTFSSYSDFWTQCITSVYMLTIDLCLCDYRSRGNGTIDYDALVMCLGSSMSAVNPVCFHYEVVCFHNGVVSYTCSHWVQAK